MSAANGNGRSLVLDQLGGPAIHSVAHLREEDRQPGYALLMQLRELCGSIERSGFGSWTEQPYRARYRYLRDVSETEVKQAIRITERSHAPWSLNLNGDDPFEAVEALLLEGKS